MPVLPDALEIPDNKGLKNLHVLERGSLQMFFFLEVADHRDLQLAVDSLEKMVRPPSARAFGKSEVKKEILFRKCDDFFFHGSFALTDTEHVFEDRPEFSGDRFRKEAPANDRVEDLAFQREPDVVQLGHIFFRILDNERAASRDGLHESLGIQYPQRFPDGGPADVQQSRDLFLANEGPAGILVRNEKLRQQIRRDFLGKRMMFNSDNHRSPP